MAGSGRHRADETLIASLATGVSIKEAAAQADVGERTAFRRLNDPSFRQRLAETKGRMLEAASAKLASSAGAACEELDRLLKKAKSESVRLAAARVILEQVLRMRDLVEIDQRLTALEREVKSV
jgi:transposase